MKKLDFTSKNVVNCVDNEPALWDTEFTDVDVAITARIVTKAPGRAVATEGRCVRAGGNESQRRLSSAVSPVYSTRTNMHFDTTGHSVRSYILLQCHRYTESPLCSLLETAYRPDAAIACSLM